MKKWSYMRVLTFFKFYLLLLIVVFLGMSMVELRVEQKVLVFLLVTLLSPTMFRQLISMRGVRKGDLVLVSYTSQSNFGTLTRRELGRALSRGREGDVIEVEFSGRVAKAEVRRAGGILMPPEVNLLYYEDIPASGRWST